MIANVGVKKYFKTVEAEERANEFIKELRTELFLFGIECLYHVNTGSIFTIKSMLVHMHDHSKEEAGQDSGQSDYLFYQALLNIIYFDESFGLKYEIGEFLKNVLDDSQYYVNNQGDKNLKSFYNYFLSQLLNFVCINFNSSDTIKQQFLKHIIDSKQIIIDIFNYTLIQSNSMTTQLFIDQEVIVELSNLIGQQCKHLDFFIIKFMKTVIFFSDEFMLKLLTVRLNIFDILFKILKETATIAKNRPGKNAGNLNMLGSAILDTFDCLRNKKENKTELINYIISNYSKQIKELEPYTSFIYRMLEDKSPCKPNMNNGNLGNELSLEDVSSSKRAGQSIQESLEHKFFRDDDMKLLDENGLFEVQPMIDDKRYMSESNGSYNATFLHKKRKNSTSFGLQSKGATIIHSYEDDLDEENYDDRELNDLINDNILKTYLEQSNTDEHK